MEGHEITMTHRIVQINKTDSNIVIRTKGDNNPTSIPRIDYPIYRQNYIGKVVYKIPILGLVWWHLTYPPITFGIIAAGLIPCLYLFIFRNMKKRNQTTT
jgi:signal peptidase